MNDTSANTTVALTTVAAPPDDFWKTRMVQVSLGVIASLCRHYQIIAQNVVS